jgi:glycosyltransferase involved in cell wall biosynthesis
MVVGAVESALSQTWDEQEIIVVNDGSTDDTTARLQAYQDKIHLIQQDNQGAGPAKNRGLEAARGKYVAILDDDDRWEPTKLEVQIAFLESHSECVGCVVPWAVSTAPEKPVFNKEDLCDSRGYIINPTRNLYRHLFWTPSASLVRQKALGPKVWYGTDAAPDHDFNLRLFAQGPIGVAGDEVLVTYRIHPNNLSITRPDGGLRGIRYLRKIEWEDVLNEVTDGTATSRQISDVRAFLADRSRSTLIRMLMAKERKRAWALFRTEFYPLLSQGKALFVLGFIVFWILPPSVSRWYWRDELGAQEIDASGKKRT